MRAEILNFLRMYGNQLGVKFHFLSLNMCAVEEKFSAGDCFVGSMSSRRGEQKIYDNLWRGGRKYVTISGKNSSVKNSPRGYKKAKDTTTKFDSLRASWLWRELWNIISNILKIVFCVLKSECFLRPPTNQPHDSHISCVERYFLAYFFRRTKTNKLSL
jgi:hypothetical protein